MKFDRVCSLKPPEEPRKAGQGRAIDELREGLARLEAKIPCFCLGRSFPVLQLGV